MDPDYTHSILLIDDDAFLLEMYSIKFKEDGFEVVAAEGAEEALGKLHEGFTPTAIVLDLIMPTIDGLGFLSRRKAENLAPEAIIIVLSNQGDTDAVEEAKKLGAHDYILKANTIPSEVVTKVREVIKRREGTH